MKKHYREENDCLNCGTILVGHFCHNCGQENLQIKESFGHMMNHAISDYFHFDHNFFHTLKPLFFKPGMLTNEYMAGRRVQYLHPVKMYIFISLVYFLIFFGGNHEVAKFNTVKKKNSAIERIRDSINKAAVKNINSDTGLTPKQKSAKLKQVAKYTALKMAQYSVKDTVTTNKAPDFGVYKRDNYAKTEDSTYSQYLATQNKLPANKRDGWLTRYFIKKTFALQDPKINKTQLMTESINHNFPKMMFLLLPLFALILKVTFWRSKKFYVEHLIYSFHLHCFVFLFLTIVMLLQLLIPGDWQALSGWLNFAAAIVIIWYIYKSLKVVYHRSRFRTITKMIGMSIAYMIAFVFCMVLLVLITTAVMV